MSGRDRILGRVRAALERRPPTEYPGGFGAWRPSTPVGSPIDGFTALLEAAGGEVLRCPSVAAASTWLVGFAADFETATVGETVPEVLRPPLEAAPPDVAPLGVSVARGAVAETGSLMMDARDGRRSQLLAPTHVVFVRAEEVHATLREALESVRDDLPSAIGLHSGPSKSADIGQVMVRGVHGPGRLITVVIGDA